MFYRKAQPAQDLPTVSSLALLKVSLYPVVCYQGPICNYAVRHRDLHYTYLLCQRRFNKLSLLLIWTEVLIENLVLPPWFRADSVAIVSNAATEGLQLTIKVSTGSHYFVLNYPPDQTKSRSFCPDQNYRV